LALALCVAFAIYRMGATLNLRRFFQVLGVLLMIFAAGLLADAVENLQQLNWLPFGRGVLWNSTRFVSEASNTGDVLHSLVGYADRPTLLQVALWTAYVALSTTIFIGRGRQRRRQQRLRDKNSGSDAAIVSPKESTTSTAHP
jgi:high-affinity iron transporter